MSSIATSNETGLDWLARNVHVWPTNTPKAILPGDATFKLGAVFYGDCVAFSGELGPECRRVNKADWLARRAELQNKPNWEDAPEWAVYMAQSPNGHWEFFAVKPRDEGWWRHPIGERSSANNASIRGAILGDWCDTLEKRPEEFKPFFRAEDLGFVSETAGQQYRRETRDIAVGKYIDAMEDAATAKQPSITPSKYTKTIHGVPVDVYDVLQAWGVINPALQHLIKKALQCGQRGHKDNAQDLQDIIDSAIRAKELG